MQCLHVIGYHKQLIASRALLLNMLVIEMAHLYFSFPSLRRTLPLAHYKTSKHSLSNGRRLLRDCLATRWKLMALSILFLIGVSVFTAGLAASTRLIVNDVFVAENTDAAVYVALIVIGVSLGKSVSQYANNVLQIFLKRSVSVEMQKRIFARMLHNDVAYFGGGHASDLMAKVRLYGTASGAAFVTMTNRLLTETLTMLALFGVMLYQDAWMTLFCMLILPLILVLVSFLARKVRAVASEEGALSGQYYSIGSEAFAGIKTVKSYGLEKKSTDRFDAAVDRLESRIFSIARVTAATLPIMEFLGGLVIGAFVVYAAWQTITYGKTPGEFTAFITAFLLAYQPAEKVSKYWVELQKSLVQTGHMYKILDAPTAMMVEGDISKSDLGSGLKMDSVGFSYDVAKAALSDISLDIAAGEILGVVGRSGAGKSTLIDLVMRFYDPSEGYIMLGGHDLRHIKWTDLKDTIALISQDVFLFDGTIRDNIRDGNPEASDAEIDQAAECAALDVALCDLPKGLDTIVGANGANLSGGQKQRVGIARAMIKDAKLYIFDEATSALDVENERRIMANLVKHTHDATVLFITHRTATLKYVDRVLFLDNGKVAGLGTFDALLKNNSAFKTLFLG